MPTYDSTYPRMTQTRAQQIGSIIQNMEAIRLGDPTFWNSFLKTDSSGNVALTGTLKERNRAVPMGEWTNVAYNAANFTASTGLWTVEAADQVTLMWTIIGKAMVINFKFTLTSVSAATVALMFPIPGGYTGNGASEGVYWYTDGGAGVMDQGLAQVANGGSVVNLIRNPTGAPPWSISTNATNVRGQVVISVN